MTLTIFTIIYNNYGIFLDVWLENIKKSNPDEIIVVLGKNHGVDKTKYKGIKFIDSNSDVMGTLRNLAIDNSTSKWLLYFSVDDELKANFKIHLDDSYDAIALTYVDEDLNNQAKIRKSAIFNKGNIYFWQRLYAVPGYIAYKKVINGVKVRYEDIEIPNYPFLFMLASIGAKQKQTNTICATYKRRENSHGDISNKQKRFIDFTKYIDKRAVYYGNTIIQ